MRDKGLIHVYFGDGKGKTTAAVGVALRALGAGWRVGMVQFMKGYPYSEVPLLRRLKGMELVQTGRREYVYRGRETEEDRSEARRGLAAARRFLLDDPRDLAILDEVTVALDYGLFSENDLLDLVDGKAPGTELILTGRFISASLVDRADYISEVQCRRHPYERGLLSREGIDH
ncbi:MAG: cob(I)yrinic acid a,c-diamide adenosyltransferase [Dethiosulfovibrio peptidovorans]|nr:MAG: cob(I)yrinic acid a,c-diamide adenosyltransferase [Dethiosulfovibrio peptidovorans]